MTKAEPDVYAILGEALHESLPKLKVEMLIADSSRAHFRRAFTNDEGFEGCGVASPLDCPAAVVGHGLFFPSSRALDACPYLKDRPSGDVSAACIPVSIAGRTVGVTHTVGPDNKLPTKPEIETLNFTSRRGSRARRDDPGVLHLGDAGADRPAHRAAQPAQSRDPRPRPAANRVCPTRWPTATSITSRS